MTMQNQPPERPEDKAGNWATQEASKRATAYAVGKATRVAAKTALGAQVFVVMRWVVITEWGALALWVLLGLLAVVGLLMQGQTLLGIFVLILAAFAFGVWLAVRKVRRFVESRVEKAYEKFESLVEKGIVRASEWPVWYRQHRNEIK